MKDIFCLVTSMGQRQNSKSSWGTGILEFLVFMGTLFFSVPHLWQDEKYLSLFLPELKTYHLSYSVYKHDATDIANPAVCRMCVIWTSLQTSFTIESFWLSGRELETLNVWFRGDVIIAHASLIFKLYGTK